MSRQRLRQGMLEGSTKLCPSCEGRGVIRSVSSCALSVLRSIEEQFASRKPENLTATCNREVASYILNDKRDHLLTLEQNFGISIYVVPSDSVKSAECAIEFGAERAAPARRAQPQTQAVKMETALGEEPNEVEEPETVEAAGSEAASAPETSSEAQDESFEHRRGRRRGRRGRHGRRRGANGQKEYASGDTQAQIPGTGSQPFPEPDSDAAGQLPEAGSGENVEVGGQQQPGRRLQAGDGRGNRGRDPMDTRERRGETNGQRETASPDRTQERTPRDASLAGAEDLAMQGNASRSAPPAAAEEETTVQLPRRWEPPAATIERSNAPRKGGWWQKRS